MKHLKTYNESLRDKMQPKSEKDLLNILKGLSRREILEKSVKNNFIRGVEIAIERGVDIESYFNEDDDYDSGGNSALMLAAKRGYLKIVKLLINKGANVNTTDDSDKTALMTSVIEGHKEIVEILLENGADINAKNDYDETALHFAISFGNTEIAKILINRGADINIEDSYGETALTCALNNKNKEIVKLIRKQNIKE